ncbi:MAG: malonyl-CoA decarboxylase [Proteobacteria bacterium]|nr:malonyl-CoA decarboxylase [Pseudomonadota bacterium]
MAPRFLRRLFSSPKDELGLLAESLLSERGEASGVALARELLTAYSAASEEVKLQFLLQLAQRFGADLKRIDQEIKRYAAAPGPEQARELHEAAESRLQELLRRVNLAPGGTAVLVRMREDVLRNCARYPELKPVDADFRHLFVSWFNRGFLVLRPIDWSTPAAILEKIIQYEAVHEINGWSELRGRLDPADRRCFAFFHPALADEPLIFVEVALTRALPEAIAPLLAPARAPLDPKRATTAVFYSISNCQPGLQGVSFGNFLIKQVVEELRRDMPHLKTFVTLSPVPGFRQWLQRDAKAVFSASEFESFKALDRPGWHESAETARTLQPLLQRAIGTYLLEAKHSSGKPRDPVSRFHLNNGASLERVNWLGDVSPKGLREAAGFMVNYLYDLDEIEENHENFAHGGAIAASRHVRNLLRAKRPVPAKS